MKDERLYIDGELVDIDDTTKITMNIKSNLFRDVSKIASNSTYTVKLPKTVRNQMILKHADLVQARDGYPYLTHTARYFRNGVEVIKDGRLTVLQVTETAIEVCIVWGLFPNFSKLMNAGTTLNQLKSNDRLLYKSSNEVNTYEDALKANYFYADYDVWTHEKKVDYTWRSGTGMTYPVSHAYSFICSSAFFGEGHFGRRNAVATDNGVENLHPVVKASYVLELVKKQTGIDFSFIGAAKEYVDTLIIPLINKKSNELTFDGQFKADIQASMNAGALSLKVTEASSVFDAGAGNSVSILNVKSDANVIIDFKGDWQFDITGARPNGQSSWSFDGENITYDSYNFRNFYYIKMTVISGTESTEYIIGRRERNMVKVPTGYQGICKFQYSGYGKIEVKAGGSVKLEWLSDGGLKGGLKGAQFLGGTLKTTLSSDENVPSGGYYPISYNLPKIKIIDFVKFLAAITGTFPVQMSKDNIVEFVPLSTVWDNRGQAKDWTGRIIAQGNENKPKAIDFRMEDYAQHNYYKWKADDKVLGDYNGDLAINNETLDTEKTIFEFPFAATNGSNVPMYTAPDYSSEGKGGHFGTGRREENGEEGKTTMEDKPSYHACKDRILRLTRGNDGKAVAVFDINMQEIIRDKYRHVAESLRNAKIVTETVRIRDLELIDFDETKPVYLAQYGSYFAITEIKADENGYAEVTMFQLYND